MMRGTVAALAAKEIRNLRPLILGLLALEAAAIFQVFVTRSPDQDSWFSLSALFGPGTEIIALVLFFVGVIGGYSVFSRERSEGTLRFLWALPLRRRDVYLVKLGTAVFVLAVYAVLSLLLTWAMHTMTASVTLAEQFSWRFWGLELVLLAGLQAIGVCYGALVAWFGLAGVLGLIALLFASTVVRYAAPELAFVTVDALIMPEFRGTELLFSGEAWLFHGTLALIAAAAAGWLWTRRIERVVVVRSRPILPRKVVNGALYLGALLVVLIMAGTRFLPGETVGATPDRAVQRIESERFVFSFFEQDRSYAERLSEEAPALYLSVTEIFGTRPARKVLVDMTDESVDHLGIAGWRRLRIQRSALPDADTRQYVFAHELAHVIAAEASDRRLVDHADATRFFNEGLAEWVAYRVVERPERTSARELLAAVAWQRLQPEFDDLSSSARFNARFDEGLLYALGWSWVATLAEVCGESAPIDAVAAMASADLPQRIGARELWREVLGRSGCRLGAVNGSLAARLEELEIDAVAVPLVTGTAELDAGLVRFSVGFEGGSADRAYRVLVRARDNPSDPRQAIRTQSRTIAAGERAEILLPGDFVSGRRFQYQLGVEFVDGEMPYFGRWVDQG